MGERRGAYRVLVENLKEGDYLENPGINGKLVLKWIFKKWDGAWTRSVADFCEYGDEPRVP
jgi:hypothetical protein